MSRNPRVPDKLSAQVVDFCLQISSANPVYISTTPDPGCEINDCFNCVRQKVVREGGRIQFGWSIWEWPKVYIEAEHHAVYAPPDISELLDITPSAVFDTRRLFLLDDSRCLQFRKRGRAAR